MLGYGGGDDVQKGMLVSFNFLASIVLELYLAQRLQEVNENDFEGSRIRVSGFEYHHG